MCGSRTIYPSSPSPRADAGQEHSLREGSSGAVPLHAALPLHADPLQSTPLPFCLVCDWENKFREAKKGCQWGCRLERNLLAQPLSPCVTSSLPYIAAHRFAKGHQPEPCASARDCFSPVTEGEGFWQEDVKEKLDSSPEGYWMFSFSSCSMERLQRKTLKIVR